jgi:hypothetical protein
VEQIARSSQKESFFMMGVSESDHPGVAMPTIADEARRITLSLPETTEKTTRADPPSESATRTSPRSTTAWIS